MRNGIMRWFLVAAAIFGVNILALLPFGEETRAQTVVGGHAFTLTSQGGRTMLLSWAGGGAQASYVIFVWMRAGSQTHLWLGTPRLSPTRFRGPRRLPAMS